MATPNQEQRLKRELNVFHAVMIGLGSILGTGIFVSVGIAAGVTGPSVLLAIVLAAFIAMCNAFSSAQLAASHPVSGGTYEYGYRYLHPALGFTAGWMFLCAKTASAASAAMGFAGYFMHLISIKDLSATLVAVLVTLILTLCLLAGIKKTSRVNMFIVSITLMTLIAFVIVGMPKVLNDDFSHGLFSFDWSIESTAHFLYATALMFVAYTGYGRIATMAEEVKNPRKGIPQAIIITLVVSALLYVLVTTVALGTVGAEQLGIITQSQASPLEHAGGLMQVKGLETLMAIGACTAMLGVLLNLILGLSRVTLAMGRKGDLPTIFARIHAKKATPVIAIITTGSVIMALTLIGNIETTWAFSAFAVLIYYSLTNLAALRLPKENRLFPRVFAIIGLLGCLFLAFWVPVNIWFMGVGLIGAGFIWHYLAQKFSNKIN